MNRRVTFAVLCLALMGWGCASTPEPQPMKKAPPPPPSQVADADLDPVSQPPGTTVNGIPTLNEAKKTRYQKIAEGFDDAGEMPTLNDFELIDEPMPKQVCYSVKAADPGRMSEVVIRQMMVQIEGTPDFGPLFPGTLDRVEPRLVIGKNNGWVNSQNLTNEKRQVFELSRMSGSLIIRIVENRFGIYQDIGAPAEVWIRKNDQGLIYFKVFKIDNDRKRTEVFIGYCYRKP